VWFFLLLCFTLCPFVTEFGGEFSTAQRRDISSEAFAKCDVAVL